MKCLTYLFTLFGICPSFATATLQVGEVWTYKTRPGEESSTVTILKREELAGKPVIHIRVDGLKVKNSHAPKGLSDSIPHMPFDEAALTRSLVKKLKSVEKLPDFSEGYAEWKNAKGGVFTIPLKDAVSFIEQTINK